MSNRDWPLADVWMITHGYGDLFRVSKMSEQGNHSKKRRLREFPRRDILGADESQFDSLVAWVFSK